MVHLWHPSYAPHVWVMLTGLGVLLNLVVLLLVDARASDEDHDTLLLWASRPLIAWMVLFFLSCCYAILTF